MALWLWSCGCGCGHVVNWSCGQLVMWSSGQVVKWSCGQVVMWYIETQCHYERQFSPHLSDNIKDATGLSRDICSQSGTIIKTYLWVHWGAQIFQYIIGYSLRVCWLNENGDPHVIDKQYSKLQVCTLRVHCTLRVWNQNGGPHSADHSKMAPSMWAINSTVNNKPAPWGCTAPQGCDKSKKKWRPPQCEP